MNEVMQNEKTSRSFFSNVKSEIKKITWPDQKTLVKATWLVVFVVGFYTLYITVLDMLLAELFILLRGL